MLKVKLLKILTLKEKEKYLLLIISFLSLIVVFCLIEISETKKKLKAKNRIEIHDSVLKKRIKKTHNNIDNFINLYLEAIFKSDSNTNLSWLEKHSDEIFFHKSLKEHLLSRFNKKIISNFIIKRIYREDLKPNLEKIIIFGEEKFINSSYQNRVLVIELILNNELLKVQEIISIKTLNE